MPEHKLACFHFGDSPPQPAVPQWQGYSVATWDGLREGAVRIYAVSERRPAKARHERAI